MNDCLSVLVAWISLAYFESLLLPQLLRGENDSKQSDEIQAKRTGSFIVYCTASAETADQNCTDIDSCFVFFSCTQRQKALVVAKPNKCLCFFTSLF